MGSSITVRDIDPGDRSWLRREASRVGGNVAIAGVIVALTA